MDKLQIDKEVGDLAYNDDLHIYWNKKTGAKYTSVTTLIGKYHSKFDSKYWSEYKALESIIDPDIFKTRKRKYKRDKEGRSKAFLKAMRKLVDPVELENAIQDIYKQWRKTNTDACKRGSIIHLEKEKDLLEKGFMIYGANYLNVKTDHLVKFEDGVYPELMMYDNEYMISGQADRIVKEGKYVDVHDYKTNKELKRTSFKDPVHGYRVMHKPISHLHDCNFVHYQIQLSIYAYILERKGLIPRKLTIEYIDHSGNEEIIEIPYLRDEVISLLKHFKRYKSNASKTKSTRKPRK